MAVSVPMMEPAASSDLRALADSIGCILPESYLAFAKLYNGATPQVNSIKTSDNEVSVSRFIPVKEALSLAAKIEGLRKNAILFAEDGSGNYFYISSSDGSVYFWDHELDGVDEKIAADPFSLVQKLQPFDASVVTLSPGQVTRIWVNPNFKPEF